MTTRQRWLLAAIVVVAAGVRVVWCLYAARPPSDELHDPNFYRFFGEQLAHGNGYRLLDGQPTAYYPVGYSLSLAAAFWVVYRTPLPDDIETGVIAAMNIGWQVVAVLACFAVAWRVTRRVEGGLLAAAAVALWPNLVFHTAVALSESLFMALFLGAVVLAVAAPWDERRFEGRRLVAIGLLLGAATLVRPVSAPFFPALALVLLLAGFGWRRALGHTAVVTAVAVAVVTPWLVRNAVVMDEVTLSTNTGDNLCMSRRVGGSGTFELPNPRCFSGPFDDLPRPDYETERDAQGRRLAYEFVRDHPGEEVRLWWRRARHTFRDDTDGLFAVESYGTDAFIPDGRRSALRSVGNWYYVLVGTAGLAGLVRLAISRSPRGLLVVAAFVGLLLPPLLFFGDPRFHVPAIPLAAVGLGALPFGAARSAPGEDRGVAAGAAP